jgi:hypothetical protein
VIYILRMPKSQVIRPIPWQNLKAEDEWTIFNSVPAGSVVKVFPASRIAPLVVDGRGLLTVAR